jgi:uncharacterized short protein YbdD (DUF466 family)
VICSLCEIGPGLALFGRRLKQTADLMVGQSDYDTYLAHRQLTHPDEPAMSRIEFFRACQDRRYGGPGGGGLRCC